MSWTLCCCCWPLASGAGLSSGGGVVIVMLKRFIPFLLLGWLLAGSAFAETVWFHYNYPADTNSSSPSGACSLGIAKMSGNTANGVSQVNATTYSCLCYWKAYPGAPNTYGTCGQAISTTKADCTPPQVRQPNGSCGQPPCATPAGQTVNWTQSCGHSKSPTAATSDPGTDTAPYPSASPTCGLSGLPDAVRAYATPSADGGLDFFCQYSGTSSGSSVPAGGAAPVSDTPPAGAKNANIAPTKANSSGGCPGGTVQVGVDSSGTPMCSGSGTNPGVGGAPTDARPTASTTTKTTDSSGNTVSTTNDTRSNGDGSTTTKKTVETVAPDGSKSVTVSETTGNRPDGKQGVPDKPDNDLCRQHPDLQICKNSSVAGSCGQISCMGDAIQCATLREAAIMECRQKQNDDDLKASREYTLGQQVTAGADPMQSSLPSAANGSTVDVSALSANGWLGAGAGFADVSFTIQGHVITIPFSKVMPYLLALRAALMVVAALVSFRILSGAILGS